jgi:uncharacterized protein
VGEVDTRLHGRYPRGTVTAPIPLRTGNPRGDSWVNAVTGLGTSIDKLARATFVRSAVGTADETLEQLYYGDDLCAKIVDKLVDAALRQGFKAAKRRIDGRADDADDVKQRGAEIDRRAAALDIKGKLTEAARWGRLYGGGAILLGVEGIANPSSPLPRENAGRIAYLTVLERRELIPHEWQRDPMRLGYGMPKTWFLSPISGSTGTGAVVHDSRLLKFEGIPVSRSERERRSGWSLSVLERVLDVIRDGQQNWRSVSLLLQNATQAVFKLKGLVDMVSNGEDQQMQKRMEIVNLARSIARAIVVDADTESFEYQNASLSGLDAILDKTWQRIAAAADMPVTILMGMSPAGMNATGESDVRGWYDSVHAYRTDVLGPQADRLVQMLAREAGDSEPESWYAEWPSLWQMTPTEETAHRKSVAEIDAIYIDKGVVTPEEVTVSRFGGGTWSPETVVDLELRESAKAAQAPELEPEVAGIMKRVEQPE